MAQAIKKAAVTKPAPLQATTTTKTSKTSKAENTHAPNLTKTNLLNRFLEASCDCV